MILFCDQKCAIRILEDAKRLNMMDGHFVWLWVDTAEMTGGQRINTNNTTSTEEGTTTTKEEMGGREKRETTATKESIKSDISDIHRNYLLRNDQYLLFNDFEGDGKATRVVRESGAGGSSSSVIAKTVETSELPSGLLSLKPLPIRVDRHLVKGAARLLMATLKVVVEQCPRCLLERRLENSCWTNSSESTNFSNFFAK